MALKTVPQPKRQIQLPTQDLTRPQDQSTITGGGGVSTVYTPKNVLTPPSISNPASLNPATKSVSPAVSQTTTTGLSKPAGYEGVAKPVYTPGVSRIDNTGADVPSTVLAKPAVPTTQATPTAQIGTATPTNGQLVQDQQVAQGLQSNILSDKNNYAQMGISEADFNNLPPDVRLKMLEEKKAQIGITQDTLKQLEAVEIIERQKQYSQAQEANRLEQEAINANIAGVQASQRLKDASKNVDDLKQKAGFLGTGGRPVKSQASIDAMGNSINEAQTTFQIMKNTEDQFAMLRGLQTESQAKAFEENMARLDDQLKAQTSSLFLKAYLDYQKEANSGKLDTPKKILEFQQRMLNTVDDSLEGITQNQLSQVNALIEAGKTYAEQMKAQTEREQKLEDEQRKLRQSFSKERSEASGVLTNELGEAMLDASGKPMTYDPLKYANPEVVGGYLIDKKRNPATGKYDVSAEKLYSSPSEVVDLLLKQTQLAKAQQDLQETKGTVSAIVQNIANPQTSIQIADFSQNKRGRENLQCGELVNDYILQATGQEPSTRFGNTLTDKINAVTKLGVTSGPVPGGIFVSNPLGNNVGHTGIVTSVNPDSSFNVLEANAAGEENGQPPINKTYKSTEGFTFSQPPKQPTKEQQKQQDVGTKEITGLRKEFNNLPEVKDYKKVTNYLNTIDINAAKKTPAGDMSLVFAYMKLLDPNSTVREGEYATAKNAGSIEDKVINAYNSTIKGTILTDKQRNDFATTAREVHKTYQDIYDKRLAEYKTYATEGGNVESIGMESEQPTQSATPGTGGRATSGRIKK